MHVFLPDTFTSTALWWFISSLNFTFSVWCTDLLRRQRETRQAFYFRQLTSYKAYPAMLLDIFPSQPYVLHKSTSGVPYGRADRWPHTHLKSQNPLMQSVAHLTMINLGVRDYLLQRALNCRPQIIARGDSEADFLSHKSFMGSDTARFTRSPTVVISERW